MLYLQRWPVCLMQFSWIQILSSTKDIIVKCEPKHRIQWMSYTKFTDFPEICMCQCDLQNINPFVMPPPLGAGGIMFSGCPSVRPSVRLFEARNTLFPPVLGSVVHPTNCDRFTACPSVRQSGEVSGHLLENTWREWPEILHADVSWPPSELISLWLQSVAFSNFGTILT